MTATANVMQTGTMRTNAMLTRTPAMAARPRLAATRTSATVNKKTTKTTLKRRRGRTLEQQLMPFLIAVAVGLTALAGGVALARRGATTALPASVTVIVRPGDTIWSLAKSFGDRSAALFDRVDSFAAANELDADANLFPGQRLIVPIVNEDTIDRLKDSGRITLVAVAPAQKGRL